MKTQDISVFAEHYKKMIDELQSNAFGKMFRGGGDSLSQIISAQSERSRRAVHLLRAVEASARATEALLGRLDLPAHPVIREIRELLAEIDGSSPGQVPGKQPGRPADARAEVGVEAADRPVGGATPPAGAYSRCGAVCTTFGGEDDVWTCARPDGHEGRCDRVRHAGDGA